MFVFFMQQNKSSIHWDIVNIQRPEYGGGEIYFDDVLNKQTNHVQCENQK